MAHVTAASTIIKLGDVEYTMSPLTDRDLEELNEWLRSSMIETARLSLSSNMTSDERQEILRAAIVEARKLDFFRNGGEFVNTVDGISRCIWQGIKRHHTNITHMQVREKMLDPATIDYIMAKWGELNVGPTKEATTREGSPKAETRSVRKKSTQSSQASSTSAQTP